MNPAMIIIIALVAIIGWFLAARFFNPTGEVVKDVIDEAVYEITADDEEAIDVDVEVKEELK